MRTNKTSAATEGNELESEPWELTIPGRPCGLTAAATSLQEVMGEEGTRLPTLKNLTIQDSFKNSLSQIVSISILRY